MKSWSSFSPKKISFPRCKQRFFTLFHIRSSCLIKVEAINMPSKRFSFGIDKSDTARFLFVGCKKEILAREMFTISSWQIFKTENILFGAQLHLATEEFSPFVYSLQAGWVAHFCSFQRALEVDLNGGKSVSPFKKIGIYDAPCVFLHADIKAPRSLVKPEKLLQENTPKTSKF